MAKYSLEIKHSVQRELDALDDTVFVRIWRVVYFIDDAAKLVTITRVAHRREVYE